jgi:hypothetical protein
MDSKMTINISYKKVDGNVIDNYAKTLKGFRNKDVTWNNMRKVVCDSSIQYSCYAWNNGVKKSKQFDNSKQDCIILDIDDGLSISDIQGMFTRYKYLLATTKSHQQEKKGVICDRFRLILPAINIPRGTDVYFRTLEIMFPWNDKQTLTKTAAFLGNDNAIYIYNDGDIVDCEKGSILAEQIIKEERIDKKTNKIDTDLICCYGDRNNIHDIKEQLDIETIREILESLGVDFNSAGKCKLRHEENTHSAKIYPSGYIKDFGCNEISGDIFHVLMKLENMSFGDAIRYVKGFVR